MDSITHDTKSNSSRAGAAPFAAEPDGFLVVSRCPLGRHVVPPYQYQYDADHFSSLREAEDFRDGLNRGEYGRFAYVAIVPCIKGIPVGSEAL